MTSRGAGPIDLGGLGKAAGGPRRPQKLSRGGAGGMPCPLRVPLAALSAVGAVAVALGALEGGAP